MFSPEIECHIDFAFRASFFVVLICGYMCMLKYALDSLVHCALIPLFLLERNVFLEGNTATLRQTLLEGLPHGKYELGESSHSHAHWSNCAICLEEFRGQDEVTVLPCDPRHHFHTGCIDAWLKNCMKCPICNAALTEGTVKSCKGYKELMNSVRQTEDDSSVLPESP